MKILLVNPPTSGRSIPEERYGIDSIKKIFEVDDVGNLDEYVGCKIERGVDYMKLTQPVMIQSYQDEFGVKSNKVRIPAPASDSRWWIWKMLFMVQRAVLACSHHSSTSMAKYI